MQLGVQIKEITIKDRQISIEEMMSMYDIAYETARKRVVIAQKHAKEAGQYIYADKGYAILSTTLEIFGPPRCTEVFEDKEKETHCNESHT